jgi:hypothetical protein
MQTTTPNDNYGSKIYCVKALFLIKQMDDFELNQVF